MLLAQARLVLAPKVDVLRLVRLLLLLLLLLLLGLLCAFGAIGVLARRTRQQLLVPELALGARHALLVRLLLGPGLGLILGDLEAIVAVVDCVRVTGEGAMGPSGHGHTSLRRDVPLRA